MKINFKFKDLISSSKEILSVEYIVIKYYDLDDKFKKMKIFNCNDEVIKINNFKVINIVKIKYKNKKKFKNITETFSSIINDINVKPSFFEGNIFYLTKNKNHEVPTIRETDYGIVNNSNLDIKMVNIQDSYRINPNKKNIIILSYSLLHDQQILNLNQRETKHLSSLLIEKKNKIIVFIQDEYYDNKIILSFLRTINVKDIFTVLTNDKDINFIYGGLSNDIQFHKALTGYVNDSYKKYYKKIKDKKNDIFYRGRKLHPKFGELGRFKLEIGYQINKYIDDNDISLVKSISSSNGDRIYGNIWYERLSDSKVTLATPSGSNIILKDQIENNTLFPIHNTQFMYDSHNSNLFKDSINEDEIIEYYNKYNYREHLSVNAISPKMFEAIAMGTALVMIEGDDDCYSGILKPNIHYIPVKKDYSNLPEVIEKIKDDNYLQKLADKAYTDIIESNKYTIKSLANSLDAVISKYI